MMRFDEFAIGEIPDPRKKRLMPSQQAIKDLMSGAQARVADEAAQETAVYVPGDDINESSEEATPNAGTAFGMAALRGVSEFANQPDTPVTPMSTPAFTYGNPVRDNAIASSMYRSPMRGYRRGGYFSGEEPIVVGEEGVEVIVPDKQGGGMVIPNDSLDPVSLEIQRIQDDMARKSQGERGGMPLTTPGFNPDASMPFGLGQTEDGTGGGSWRRRIDLSGAPVIPVTQNPQGSPPTQGLLTDPLTKAREELRQAQEIKPSPWKDLAYAALQGFNNWANDRNDPVMGWNEAKAARKTALAQRKVDMLEKQREADTQDAYRRAQTTTIPIDDENKRLQIEASRQNAADRIQAAALNKLAGLLTVDNKNPALIQLAKTGGLSDEQIAKLGQYDFRNAQTFSINGQKFERNRITGEYELTGMPESEKDKIEKLEIEVPIPGKFNSDGSPVTQTRVLNVPQSQAATILGQLQQARIQADFAQRRQANEHEHDLKKQQIAAKLAKALADHKAAIDAKKAKEAEEAAKRVVQFKAELEGLL